MGPVTIHCSAELFTVELCLSRVHFTGEVNQGIPLRLRIPTIMYNQTFDLAKSAQWEETMTEMPSLHSRSAFRPQSIVDRSWRKVLRPILKIYLSRWEKKLKPSFRKPFKPRSPQGLNRILHLAEPFPWVYSFPRQTLIPRPKCRASRVLWAALHPVLFICTEDETITWEELFSFYVPNDRLSVLQQYFIPLSLYKTTSRIWH